MSAYSRLPSAQVIPYAKVHTLRWQILPLFFLPTDTPAICLSGLFSEKLKRVKYKDAEKCCWQHYSQSLQPGNRLNLHPGTSGSREAPPVFAGLGMQGWGQHAQGGSHHRRHRVRGALGATGRTLPSDQQVQKGLPRLLSGAMQSYPLQVEKTQSRGSIPKT